MNWLKKLLHSWVSEGRILNRMGSVEAVAGPIRTRDIDDSPNVIPKMRIGFLEAMNGRILEIATATPINGHNGHHEWKNELFIVREDQNLNEAIAMLMLLKGAK